MRMLPPVSRITELDVRSVILVSLTIFGEMALDIHVVDMWLYQARPFSRALMHVRLTIDLNAKVVRTHNSATGLIHPFPTRPSSVLGRI